MGASTLTIKRGDTLPLAGVLTIRNAAGEDVSADTDFAAWSISSQARSGPRIVDPLLATATLDFIGSTNEFIGEFSATDTASFPDRTLIDIRFKDGAGAVQSTQTVILNVEDSVSEPPA